MKKEVPVNKAHRLINTGCVLLVSSGYKDRNNVMTLAWQTPVSANPLLIGIAVVTSHFTTELINESEEFVLNIPGDELLEQVNECGKVSGRDVDKFKEIDITPVQGQKVKAPLIEECLGHVECRVVEKHQIGDHIFFVGEVVAASADEDLFISSVWKEDAKLLHHLGGNQYYINGEHREV